MRLSSIDVDGLGSRKVFRRFELPQQIGVPIATGLVPGDFHAGWEFVAVQVRKTDVVVYHGVAAVASHAKPQNVNATIVPTRARSRH